MFFRKNIIMTLTYKNRLGREYYFKSAPTKTGKTKYFATMKTDGELLKVLPEGFEIYEHPRDAGVTLRKIYPKTFTKKEIEIIEKAIKKTTKLKHYILDAYKNMLTIYVVDNSNGFISGNNYEDRMRYFYDKEAEEFVVERMTYHDDCEWWFLDSSDDLNDIAEEYCKHLDKESFYDLM